MRLSRKSSISISMVIIGISLFVWVLLLFYPGYFAPPDRRHVSVCGLPVPSSRSAPAMDEVITLLFSWALMVVAMMLPKLIAPVRFVYGQSFRSARFLHIFIFVIAYLGVWMIAGTLMVALTMGSKFFFAGAHLPAIGVFVIALIWQCSRAKQKFLNRGHQHRSLSAFGWAALRDVSLFGCSHGMYCVGAGWALMLFALFLPSGHQIAMLILSVIMVSEHLEHPRPPRWAFRFSFKLFRIVLARTELKLSSFS